MKTGISQKQSMTFPWNEKIRMLRPKDFIFRIYQQLETVIFMILISPINSQVMWLMLKMVMLKGIGTFLFQVQLSFVQMSTRKLLELYIKR